MTLADLLKLANETLAAENKGNGWWVVRAETLARAVSNLLTADECGWERPEVVDYRSALGGDEPRMIAVPASWATRVSPADARVMAALLLKAADSAEETNAKT